MPEAKTLVEAASDALTESNWYEAALTCEPMEFHDCIQQQAPGAMLCYHHFYEPWHTGGAVARILLVPEREQEVLDLIGEWDAVEKVERWEREDDDRALYGDDFMVAMGFFQASSLMSDKGERMTTKLVHCLLNAHGYSVLDEAWFSLRFLWNRLTIEPRLKLRSLRRGKAWWER